MVSDILISVVIITYNSAGYVIETLESVKNQIYKNIELIVSDDGSTDETITLIKEWLAVNEDRFIHYRIVESEINTGITKNCNRGVALATGDYIKLIAGDDLLLNNCIEDLLNYCIEKNLEVVFSKAVPFYDDKIYPTKTMDMQEYLMLKFYEKNHKNQYKELLTRFSIRYSLIGAFITRDLFLNVGGFNEKYVMMEDYPFYVKVSSLGYRLCLLNKYTVKYRVHAPSTMGDFKKTRRYKLWLESLRSFEVDELLPRMKKEKMFLAIYDLHIRRLALKIYSENDSKFVVIISKIVKYLSPLTIKDKIVVNIFKLRKICEKMV